MISGDKTIRAAKENEDKAEKAVGWTLRGLYAVAKTPRENALHAGWLLLASKANYWLVCLTSHFVRTFWGSGGLRYISVV